MRPWVSFEWTMHNTVFTIRVLGFGLALLGLTVALPQRADAESVKKIETTCRPGKQTVTVEPDTKTVEWHLTDCICWSTKEQAKDQILAAIKGGGVSQEWYTLVFKEGETSTAVTGYCYSAETFNALKSQNPN